MKKLIHGLSLLALLLASAPSLASSCWVTEFAVAPPPAYQAAQQLPLAEQQITVSGTSAASSAFQPNTQLVRITCDASVSLEFGTAPTATAAKALLPAGLIEYYLVPAGQALKVAFITNS